MRHRRLSRIVSGIGAAAFLAVAAVGAVDSCSQREDAMVVGDEHRAALDSVVAALSHELFLRSPEVAKGR